MKKALLTFGLLAAAFASNLAAAPLTISTGTAAPWLVNGNPVVIESPIAAPFWINNFSDGKWVGTTSADGDLAGGPIPGTYTFTLNIGAYFGAAGVLSLQYAADNNVTWSISNGSLAGSTSCLTDTCFAAVGGAPRSLTGSFAANSVLTATVVNTATSPTPMGLLAVGTADALTGVPEPSTYAMMFIGGAAIFMARRRK